MAGGSNRGGNVRGPSYGESTEAIEFASRKHSTQRRKDKDASPYINHPIAVTHLLPTSGGSPTS